MKKSLFRNTLYKTILNIVNIVVPLIIGPYIVKLLNEDLYGAYNRIYSQYQIFLAIASFGIYTFGVREISKIRDNKDKVSKIFSNLFLYSAFSNILVIIIYIIFAYLTTSGYEFMIFFIFMFQIIANIFYVEFVNEALENYKFITIKSIIVKLLYFAFVLIFVREENDILNYACVVSFVNVINNLISFIYVKRRVSFDFSTFKKNNYFKPLFSILVITNIDLLYGQLDRVMLGSYVSDRAVTEYYIPYYVVATLYAIPQSIVNVSIPRLSYILQNEGKEKYTEKLNNSISALLFLVLPMCFGVFVLAKEVIILYAGKRYLSMTLPLLIACMTRIGITLEAVINHLVMYPNNKEKRILRVSLLFGILNTIVNYILIYFDIFSPSTALLTTGILETIVFIVQYIYIRNKMNINISVFSKKNIIYLILSILFIPVSIIIRLFGFGFYINIILIVSICIILYFFSLLIIKDNNLYFILSKIKNIAKGKINEI